MTAGFSVSLPDLAGMRQQLETYGNVYRSIGENFDPSSNTEDPLGDPLEATNKLAEELWKLLEDLFGFEARNLRVAHADACTRMADGITGAGDRLHEIVHEYKNRDSEARDLLKSEELSTKEEDRYEDIDEAITDEGSKFNWKAEVEVKAFKSYNPNDGEYASKQLSYYDPMSEMEGIYGAAASGGVFGTLDAAIQEIFGTSPTKEIIKLFLGNWGYFRYVADLCQEQSNNLSDLKEIVIQAKSRIAGGECWTGTAADSVANYLKELTDLIHWHEISLKDTSSTLRELTDQIEETAEKIVPLLQTIANGIGSAISSAVAKSPIPVVIWTGTTAYQLAKTDFATITDAMDALADYIEKLRYGTLPELVENVNKLNPPGL